MCFFTKWQLMAKNVIFQIWKFDEFLKIEFEIWTFMENQMGNLLAIQPPYSFFMFPSQKMRIVVPGKLKISLLPVGNSVFSGTVMA